MHPHVIIAIGNKHKQGQVKVAPGHVYRYNRSALTRHVKGIIL